MGSKARTRTLFSRRFYLSARVASPFSAACAPKERETHWRLGWLFTSVVSREEKFREHTVCAPPPPTDDRFATPPQVYYSLVTDAALAHSRQNLHVWISMSLCRTPHAEQRASQRRGSNVLRSPCSAASHLPSSGSSAPVRVSSLPQASSLPCATSSSSLQCACR